MLNSRTDDLFTAYVDAAAGSCRVRGQFWRDLKDRGFEFAFGRMVRSSSNAVGLNLVREYYNANLRRS